MCHLSNEPTINNYLIPHRKFKSESEFGYYLAGQIEGDGQFVITDLEIVLNSKDIAKVYKLREKIGFGQIYKSKLNNSVKFYKKRRLAKSIKFM